MRTRLSSNEYADRNSEIYNFASTGSVFTNRNPALSDFVPSAQYSIARNAFCTLFVLKG